MDNENYTFELEQALTKLLDFFEPDDLTGGQYYLYDSEENIVCIPEDLAQAIDHANEILYGDSYNDD